MQVLLKGGGFQLAHTPDECIQLINRYLENPDLDTAGRDAIREREIGLSDGRAGERLAAVFHDQIREKVSHALS